MLLRRLAYRHHPLFILMCWVEVKDLSRHAGCSLSSVTLSRLWNALQNFPKAQNDAGFYTAVILSQPPQTGCLLVSLNEYFLESLRWCFFLTKTCTQISALWLNGDLTVPWQARKQTETVTRTRHARVWNMQECKNKSSKHWHSYCRRSEDWGLSDITKDVKSSRFRDLNHRDVCTFILCSATEKSVERFFSCHFKAVTFSIFFLKLWPGNCPVPLQLILVLFITIRR